MLPPSEITIMSASARSSDSEGGGARLVSSATSVSEEHLEPSLSSSPNDDEGAHAKLIQASASFGSDNQQCYNAGTLVAQSVPPMTDVFGQGSPYRRDGQYHNRQNGTQAISRYNHRKMSSTDSTNSVFGSGPAYGNGTGFVSGNPSNVNSSAVTADLHRRIMTAQQLVTRAQGIPANVAREHESLLKGISQTITRFTAEMTQARDFEATRYKRAMYDRVPSFEDTQSKLKIQQLQHELSMKVARMEHLEEQVETYKAQAQEAQEEARRVEKSALKFRRHHCKVIEEYKEQDDTHYKQFEQQDAELRALRGRIDELSVQQNSQALVRASDFAEQTSVMTGRNDNMTPRAGSFNPQAPAWSPEQTMMSPPARPVSRFVRENSSQFGSQASMSSPFASAYHPDKSLNSPSAVASPGGALLKGSDNSSGSPAEEGGMPSENTTWSEVEVRQGLNHLYNLVKGVIVSCHKEGKPQIPDEMIPTRVPQTFEFMVDLVYPDNRQQGVSHLRHIMRVPNYRPYLLKRMMLDYLFKKMLGPSLFMGFTLEMDGHLKALQDQISNMATTGGRSTSRDRQRVIDQHANLLRAIIRHPHSKNWRRAKVNRFTEMLCMMLEPMRSESVPRESAMKSIRIIVNATWIISEKIWTSGMTLHYLFPECGCKFACGSMTAVNQTEIQVSSQEQLQYNQYRVLLVITPTLTLRDERNPDRLRTSGISRSEVIVMK